MLLIRLSLRNLLRQRRRNILLGSAMAIGVAILVTANSFSHGISDIMFNKIMRYVTGHVAVRFNERGGVMREIFRDKERVLAAIKNEPLIEEANESIGMFARAIGNGRSDNIILVGVDTKKTISKTALKEVEESFRLVEGNWKDVEDLSIENPVIISAEKARYLNVKRRDVVRVRFRNMFGQDQAARLTVVGIMRNDNIFMQPVVFLELPRAKELLGYRPYETGSLSLKIKDPQKNAFALAGRIHERLKPGAAVIYASVSGRSGRKPVAVFGYKSDDEAKKKISGMLKLSAGSFEKAFKKDGVIVPAGLARTLGVSAGDAINIRYDRKFEKTPKEASYNISAVCSAGGYPGENVILMNDSGFYDLYYEDMPRPFGRETDNQGAGHKLNAGGSGPKERGMPAAPGPEVKPYSFPLDSAWSGLVAPEWILLKRTYNTDEYRKKYQEIGRNKWKGTTIDVSTMYETASDILKLESVLNIITISAVVVLFFIILLGVVNTLRMTIRERTREIGTVRSIGMQRADVRNMFILETFFLTLFSSISGIIMGFAAMKLLTLITFTVQDNPLGMLLVNSHLYFLPTFSGIAGSVTLIMAIAVVTAWFPAHRGANLPPAQALRHYT
ncbi:MAG: FtsX-like permease family protein [Elusimicrobia bacterium]|nr:FtsX-like permease family protein [Elusimicrobiota bacterium]